MGGALSAISIMFSVADSVVFHRLPYADAERLVEIQRDTGRGRGGSAFLSAALLDEWRDQSDLFTGVHGFLTKTLFLSGAEEPEIIPTADVTVGLIELLGARPRWGRSFVDGDDRQLDLQPVLIAESLARRRFGEPAAALGRRLQTTGEPLIVIGVMPADFQFPDGSYRLWRSLDPRGPLTRNFVGVSAIARVAPGVSLELLARTMRERSAEIGRAAGAVAAYSAQPGPLRGSLVGADQRQLFLVLLGAAACLMLIACANVASLELANAVERARTYAIHLAVGASRVALARIALLEGACLIGTAVALAIALTFIGIGALARFLPSFVTQRSANPIDLDGRALLFMAAAAAVVWLLSSLPVVFYATRQNLLDLLKLQGHGASESARSGWIRRSLTVIEVALAVMLLVGSVVYVRSYLALLAVDKGFDTAGVLGITALIPPQAYPAEAAKRSLSRDAVERLRALPGVIAVTDAEPPPSTGARYLVTELQINGRPPIEEEIIIAELNVEPEYFSILRIPRRAGRLFQPGEPPTSVIVSETFAARFWPEGSAVGGSYRMEPGQRWMHIVGVVGHVRTPDDPPGGHSTTFFQTYVPRRPPRPPATDTATPPVDTGGHYGFIELMARVDSRSRAGGLYQTVRAMDSQLIVNIDFVDDAYAREFEDRLLATRVVGGFGLLAFAIAMAGIYGVMVFLVAHRAQEIGIRIALGADQARIIHLVLGSALRMVTLGSVLGIAGAVAAARWVRSQLFGVNTTDPGTIAIVTLSVIATGLLATWQPARRASRIDPNTLLKN